MTTEEKPDYDYKNLSSSQAQALSASRTGLTFHERFLLARIEIGELKIVKDAQGYNYKYAPLDSILKDVTPVLHKFGLTISYSTTLLDDGWHNVSCDIEGPNGGVKTTSLAFPPQHDAQGAGSFRTYYCRYNTNSILALSLEEDDDGDATIGNKADPSQKSPSKKYDSKDVPAGDHVVTPTLCNVAKEGDTWKLWVIKCEEGDLATFSSTVSGVATECVEKKAKMKVRVAVSKNGKLNCDLAKMIEGE